MPPVFSACVYFFIFPAQVATASLPALLRLGCGGLALGYEVSLTEDDGKYSITRMGERKVSETSKVWDFP